MFGFNKSNVSVVSNGVFNLRNELVAKINFKMNNEIAYLDEIDVLDLHCAIDQVEKATSVDELRFIAAGIGVDFGVQVESVSRLSKM